MLTINCSHNDFSRQIGDRNHKGFYGSILDTQHILISTTESEDNKEFSMSMLVKVIRSQDGKDDKDNDKGSKSRSQSMKEQAYNEDKDQEHSSLNDKSNLTDLMKEFPISINWYEVESVNRDPTTDLVGKHYANVHVTARPLKSNLKRLKEILKNLKVPLNMGVLYQRILALKLTAFSDTTQLEKMIMSDALILAKALLEGIHFPCDKLVIWMAKKRTALQCLSAECRVHRRKSCKYVLKVMWMRTQLQVMASLQKIPCTAIYQSAISNIQATLYNIREQSTSIHHLPEDRFKYLVRRIGIRCLTPADLGVLTNKTA
ncbi:hypothetical protein Tco_1080018 [Tanacetum coccineum]|uniref:Uncharacterized protein n=1 Tax=Tanacetum coccineum TaxID=301880 RepID=A0ABQ5HTK1_9ASTR